MKANVSIDMTELISAILDSNPKMTVREIRKYIVNNLVMDENGDVDLELTFEDPKW